MRDSVSGVSAGEWGPGWAGNRQQPLHTATVADMQAGAAGVSARVGAGAGGVQCTPSVCLGQGTGTHQLDVVDCLLSELLKCPLGLRLQGEGQALQGLVFALHADLCLHLGMGEQ